MQHAIDQIRKHFPNHKALIGRGKFNDPIIVLDFVPNAIADCSCIKNVARNNTPFTTQYIEIQDLNGLIGIYINRNNLKPSYEDVIVVEDDGSVWIENCEFGSCLGSYSKTMVWVPTITQVMYIQKQIQNKFDEIEIELCPDLKAKILAEDVEIDSDNLNIRYVQFIGPYQHLMIPSVALKARV